MKLQTRKLVSVIVAFVMILVCAVPAFAAAPSNSAVYYNGTYVRQWSYPTPFIQIR